MEALKLYWLGQPVVELKGRPVKLETRKAVALLAYLSLAPGENRREILATMFWPDGSQQKALASLRRTLSSLNSSLPGWIDANRESIRLKRNAKLWVDVEAFQQLFSQRQEHTHSEHKVCKQCLSMLEQTVDLYRGDFFHGLNLSDSPGYDEWQFFQRDTLRQKFADALQSLSSAYACQGDWARAIACARRWVALDRLHEPASRMLMELYARSGQRTSALRQYEELKRLLNEQVGQEPEAETCQLYEQLRGREGTRETAQTASGASSLPLLKTKLYIPAKPASRVIRSRLVERMNDIPRKPLTLISAPAGFGKTTLLAEWIAQTSLPVAWLSVDQRDNDPYRFLSYLIAALESVQEGVGCEAQQLIQSTQMTPTHIILAAVLNELGKLVEPMVLVLDDVQFVTHSAVHESLAYLLAHLPTNLHLVISTRADPPLQLGRLRATDQLLELRTQDMRFTPAEATQFLNDVMRLELSADEIEALEGRTEGWVVGLQMAALSLKKTENASGFIKAFSGSQRYILDYLMEEVLRSQPAPIQSFLLETSILDKFSGSLCDALVTEESRQAGESGQTVLEYLERSNLFLIPLDDHKHWYRYHHLFVDLLRARLEQSSSERVSALHAKASQWFESQGYYNEAVEHALLSRDFHRSADLLDKSSQTRVLINAFMVQKWIEQIPEEIVREHPWIQISQAWLLLAMGKLERVPELLQQAEKAVQSGDHQSISVTEAEDIRGNIAMLRAYLAFFRGEPHLTIEQATLALQKVRPSNNFLRSRILLQLGESNSVIGELQTGIRFLYDAIASSTKEADYSVATVGYFRLGNILKIMGRLVEAEGLYHQNIRALKEMGGYDSPMLGKPEIGLGDLLRERGELEKARDLLATGHKHTERQGQPYDLVYSYIHLARLAEAEGKLDQTLDLLSQTEPLFLAYTIPPVVRLILEGYQVSLWLRVGNLRQAERWVTESQLDPRMEATYPAEVRLIAFARVLIAQEKFAEAQDLLRRLAAGAETGGRNGRLIEILILQALTFQETGQRSSALEVLLKSLKLAEPEGYLRIFLDEGGQLIELLKELRDSTLDSRLNGYVNRLLENYISTP